MEFSYPIGATPLDLDEIEGLKVKHITLQGQLDQYEQLNIKQAEQWAFRKATDPVSNEYIKGLHKRMFDQVWKWAGQFRKSDKNIGVPWWTIGMELDNLCGDVKTQITHKSFSADELALRFHHRLVSIHPFPNGNGRLARMAADVLIIYLGNDRFTWGKNVNLTAAGETRTNYINALRAADCHDYGPLLEFSRS